jgi:hypothetical protein
VNTIKEKPSESTFAITTGFNSYDAISSALPLSVESVERNGEPVKFPNFTEHKPQK